MPDNTAATKKSHHHLELERNCERQHIYPLYRVLEDEFIHQHGELPAGYLEAKKKIDLEVDAELDTEINAEIAAEIEHEMDEYRKAAKRQKKSGEISEENLRHHAEQQIEMSFAERKAKKRKQRYVTLVNQKFTAELYKHIHDLKEKRTALCFSGGGIRSASFGLGIVQGLARYGMLGRFDYLSTVSGGGYLGSWLSAWIHRARLAPVIEALKNAPEKDKLQPEPEPIRHLRSYSNYLNPKLGFLSADTWTLVAIVVRNLVLNWLVLVPIILAALMLPRIVVAVVQMNSRTGMRVNWAFWLGTAFGLLAIIYMGVARPSANKPRKLNSQRLNQQGWFLTLCLMPLSLSAICLTSGWAWRSPADGSYWFADNWLSFVIYGVALHFAGYVVYTIVLLLRNIKFWRERWARNWLRLALEPLVVILVGGLWGVFTWWGAHSVFLTPVKVNPVSIPRTELYACFAAPLFILLFLLALILFVGITSDLTDDDDREWWARFGAWALIVSVLWGVVSALVIFGPYGLMHLRYEFRVILAALGGASGVLTILGGKSAKTSSHPEQEGKPGGLADFAMKLAAPIFALTLLIVFSLGTSLLIRKLAGASFDWHDVHLPGYAPYNVLNTVHYAQLDVLLILTFALVAVSLVMATRVNVNKFSLHSMYRNRLIRAYMGASRPRSERRPNPFTGFDAYDNLPMHELRHYRGAPDEPKRKLMHVVNICLNLTSGHNLAWQQRKAETFTVSPLHCGNFQLGYRKTHEYGGGSAPPGDGISLGTAVTISGAAASPNMGYHSSPALAFLMTLFNARLGWWLGNPGRAGNDKYSDKLHSYNRSGPRFALRPILAEALGQSDNTSPYVYLSDGGHFENLGLYEMVLRRAHLIVVGDGSQDPRSRFEDLAGAVRKIRIDLGIPIDFIGGMPIYAKDDKDHKRGDNRYCAVGLIRYSCADTDTSGAAAKDGVLVYIKPAITGGEPIDILNYASTSPAFPHESTADQNYTEQQLESYRALGSHVVQTICGLPLPTADLPLMADDAPNFIKHAYDQVPDNMQPKDLIGRFNIPATV
ncbi:MAG: hypothetical protein QOG71_2307 [Pyrinomonadaceae bacterium]|nr:hypothetical protein [Pyrinomonadaceae bacterium]